MDLATLARDSAIPSGDTSEPEVVDRHRVSMTARCFIKLPTGPTRLQESNHLDSDSKIESKGSTKEDTPVGLRTRSRKPQQMHSTASKDPNEDGPERQTEPGIKLEELLLQMISKAKEQQNEMNVLRLTLRNGLQQHESVVSELREDIAELRMQIEKNLVQKSIRPLVKPFSPRGKLSFGDAPINLRKSEFNLRLADNREVIRDSDAQTLQPTNLRKSESNLRLADKQDAIQEPEASTLQSTKLRKSESNLRSAGKQDVTQKTVASTLKAKGYRAKKRVLDTPSDHDVSESKPSPRRRLLQI